MKTVNQLIDRIDSLKCDEMNETLFEIRENLKFIKRTIHMGGFARVIESDKIEELILQSFAKQETQQLKSVKTETAMVIHGINPLAQFFMKVENAQISF